MTSRERLVKNVLFVFVLLAYMAGYFLVNELTSHRSAFYHLDLPFERDIPFYPVFVFAYLLEFAFFALAYLMIDDLAFFKKVAVAVLLCVLIHLVIFLIFPVEYRLRPRVDPERGWASQLVDFYYWMDLPYNCFPSLHVSNVVLVSFILERFRKGMGSILHPLAVLVAFSVVLVKQHYVADVLAGFFMGWFVYRQVFGDSYPSNS